MDYIIKFKNTRLYVEKMNSKEYSLTYLIENAKKYSKTDAEKICEKEEFNYVSYEKEKYFCKDEDYKVFIDSIVTTENDIKYSDLLPLIENKNNELKKDMIFLELQDKYPDNKLLDELYRVICNIQRVEKTIVEFDYDYDRQKEILVDAFTEKYLSNELTEESEAR